MDIRSILAHDSALARRVNLAPLADFLRETAAKIVASQPLESDALHRAAQHLDDIEPDYLPQSGWAAEVIEDETPFVLDPDLHLGMLTSVVSQVGASEAVDWDKLGLLLLDLSDLVPASRETAWRHLADLVMRTDAATAPVIVQVQPELQAKPEKRPRKKKAEPQHSEFVQGKIDFSEPMYFIDPDPTGIYPAHIPEE